MHNSGSYFLIHVDGHAASYRANDRQTQVQQIGLARLVTALTETPPDASFCSKRQTVRAEDGTSAGALDPAKTRLKIAASRTNGGWARGDDDQDL